MEMSPALERLFRQMCYEIGFPTENLAGFLTGEMPELLHNYPELGYYRDIVFVFKFLMAPTEDAMPKLRPWFQKEANLTWSYKPKEGYLVNGFGQQMKILPMQEEEKKGISGFLNRIFSKNSRAPLSGADPSALIGEKINNEDDVLYIRPLPDFDERLSQRDVELLISYLTVPYIRIPLVLAFFATQERINALGSPQLRQVLDDVMFEPSQWQHENEKSVPKLCPGDNRDHLSTPCGLLFNELIYSPEGILKPLEDLLE